MFLLKNQLIWNFSNIYILVPFCFKEGYVNKILIIPASNAIKEYEKLGVYICQPNLSFQSTKYIGFYHSNKIEKFISEIYGYVEEVNLHQEEVEDVMEKILSEVKSDSEKLINNKKMDNNLVESTVFFRDKEIFLEIIKCNKNGSDDWLNSLNLPSIFLVEQVYIKNKTLIITPNTNNDKITPITK